MVEPWNDSQRSLWRQILQAVQELKWTAIDVLRIGYERNNDRTEEKFDHPVTLLISVKIGPNTFEKAYEVVAACRQILESHELNDVQVEIKESEVARATSMPLPMPNLPAPDPATSSLATPDFDSTGSLLWAIDTMYTPSTSFSEGGQ
ncbi:hypothetical protein NW754_003092 [Fusarium falciforme]|nr:hypothetical protein NW754_003092 [Fusarium falciforme]